MKKYFFFAAIFFVAFVSALVSTNQAHAQENNDTLALLIWVEDSAGNKDSVWIYLKHGATDYLDPELGEVNLYGIPVENELDIRIMQRTDTNLIDTTYHPFNPGEIFKITPYWLVGASAYWWHKRCGWVPPYPENVDLKKNYVSQHSGWHTKEFPTFILRIQAQNCPLKLHLWKSKCCFIGNFFIREAIHNADNGIIYGCSQWHIDIMGFEDDYIHYL